jgi:glucose-6-phosphate isomerase
MKINLKQACGLPVILDTENCHLVLGKELNIPDYRIRMLHDLDAVWANPVPDPNREIYRYTSGLWFAADEATWKKANVIYGIVVFPPGIFGNEYNKSSGQYHPIIPPNTMATPEVYTVLHGTGYFMLQRSSPPYETIDHAVVVEVQAGETFIVPPDYGHLQINPAGEPLVFSYAVMDGMSGVYEPFRKTQGAIYYAMADKNGLVSYRFNTHYKKRIPLQIVKAGEICQLPLLNDKVTYQTIRDNLGQLEFLTDPKQFPRTVAL